MIGLTLALMVGVLFGCGVYLMLRRDPVKLIVGITLFTYGVNLLLFGSGKLLRGKPPIIVDKAAFTGDISQFVDPLPQALILTAIVISFGITAFFVVLLNLRNTLVDKFGVGGKDGRAQDSRAQDSRAHDGHRQDNRRDLPGDPFAATSYYSTGLTVDPEDYEWLEYDPNFDPVRTQVAAAERYERNAP